MSNDHDMEGSDDDDTEDSDDDDSFSYKAIWRRGNDKEDRLFCDWTIILTSSESEEKIETYHVHRGHLTNSKYFKTLLTMPLNMPERLREHEEKTSQISLCDQKMELFPFILDYLYGVFNDVELAELCERDDIIKRLGHKEDYSLALLSLARYFGIEKLIADIEMIITTLAGNASLFQDIPVGEGKWTVYSFMLSEAVAYSEDVMAKALINACAKEHASSNTYVRGMIMKSIPLTTKVKVQELSFNYLQKKYDKLISTVNDDKNSDELVKEYKTTWGCMRVAGAGVEAVNGVYNYTGCFNDRPMFSKSGMWNGRDEVFSLYYWSNRYIFISILKDIEGALDFYESELEAKEGEDITVDTAWSANSDGLIGTEPAPTVRKYGIFSNGNESG